MTSNGNHIGLVLRFGRICSSIGELSSTQTDSVTELLVGKLESFEAHLKEKPEDFGYKKARLIGRRCKIEYHEGPVVLYPKICVSFDGIEAEASTSITVCRAPRHSKIWIRLSYKNNGVHTSHPYPTTQEKLDDFFDKASLVSNKSANMWLGIYKQVMQEQADKSVKSEHTIEIKTVATDLGIAAEQIESGTFRMDNIFAEPKQFGSLPELLYLTYGEDVSNLKKYKQLSEEYKWVAMSVHGKDHAVGLFSKHGENNHTNLIGLVHEVNTDPAVLSKRARDFSRRIVEEIAPLI